MRLEFSIVGGKASASLRTVVFSVDYELRARNQIGAENGYEQAV